MRREWEWGVGSDVFSLLQTPHSPFPLHFSFEISSKYFTNIFIPPEV